MKLLGKLFRAFVVYSRFELPHRCGNSKSHEKRSIEVNFDIQTTLEQIINDLSCQVNLATQNHIKKGVLWKQ